MAHTDAGHFWGGTPNVLHIDCPVVVHALEHVTGWIDVRAKAVTRVAIRAAVSRFPGRDVRRIKENPEP